MTRCFNGAVAALLLTAATLVAAEATPTPEPEKTLSQKIEELLPGMGAKNLVDRREPQQELERMCMEASGPGKEAERREICEAIMKHVSADVAKPARVWMLRKIEPLGREEVVKGLVALLEDQDAEIRELARRALQNNPVPQAAAALRAELARAQDAPWRVAMINALAFRRDAESADTFIKLMRDANEEVAVAAVSALGKIGTTAGVKAVFEFRKTAQGRLKDEATDASLRGAEDLLARQSKAEAARIYEALAAPEESEAVRMAALHGLAAARGAEALPNLMKIVAGDDARLRLVAARCAQAIPGEQATRQLVDALAAAAPEAKAVLLDVLGKRGDTAALPAVATAAGDEKPEVRIAALGALGSLGDGSMVGTLAKAAAKGGSDEEKQLARQSLARMPGKDVDARILSDLKEAEPALAAELVNAVAARGIAEARPMLLSMAGGAPPAVRAAALAALGTLATDEDFPKLVQLLTSARGANLCNAAEKAILEVCSRPGERDVRVEAVIQGMQKAGPEPQAAMIRILAQLGGPAAFDAILAGCKAGDPGVQDAAVNAATAWKDPAATNGLLEFAKSAANKGHKSLALRGYVRLVQASAGERGAAQTFTLLRDAMKMATSAEDKKAVLDAVKAVPDPGALEFALEKLADAGIGNEAASAAVDIAVRLLGSHRDQALAAIEKVRAATTSDEVRRKADNALVSARSYCVAWLFSGPYKARGKSGEQLMDVAFEPEDPKAKVDWQPLAVTNVEHPAQFDLPKGDNRCAYVKTSILSESEQEAILAVGSDDGVKAWLNGKVVHTNNVSRGCKCGQDKANIKLRKGRNSLMLKITQGGGDFGFCAGVISVDGKSIEGLQFEAK